MIFFLKKGFFFLVILSPKKGRVTGGFTPFWGLDVIALTRMTNGTFLLSLRTDNRQLGLINFINFGLVIYSPKRYFTS